MFDFFAEINFTKNNSVIQDDFFNKQKVYQKLVFKNHSAEINHSKFVWLTKDEENDSFYEDNQYFTLVYGYVFTRLDSRFSLGKKKLNPQEITMLFNGYGEKMIDDIKGAFTILIFNKSKNEIKLFNDKLNINNVYYSYREDRFLVSSSLSAFTCYNNEFGQTNVKSLIAYYLFDFVLNKESFIENVKTISSATCLTVNEQGISEKLYWDIFQSFSNSQPEFDENTGIEKIEAVLKENLNLYLDQPKETAFALTGGYDSRTNLALLSDKVKDCFFYSYGIERSFDITIPEKISSKLGLNFTSFPVDSKFRADFDENAEIAVALGDGTTEMSRGNYVSVYKDFKGSYKQILTGLFGSELIKQPTSIGGYIDTNVRDILLSDDIDKTYFEIIERAKKENYINAELIEKYKDSIYHDMKNNPFLNNEYNGAPKFFFFIVGMGICNYFRKEISTERPFVENLHPFLDIEFVEILLKTPFPWIYNWGNKKSLVQNLKIHKFYALLIHRNNKILSNIISTHAYRPKLLLKKIYLPVLILEYLFYSRKINKIGIFKNEDLFWEFYSKRKEKISGYAGVFNNTQIETDFNKNLKIFTKLGSLQIWMFWNNLKL